jgi:menaquinol-cytochrome c reductase iron-sulfur subunit
MSLPGGLSRREMLAKVGILFTGAVSAVLAVPIVGYLVSPVARALKGGSESWLSLGDVGQFPAGQTRLATYRDANGSPWDGETANVACWVRSLGAGNFQVFAVNCAHLGCPVRWFPESNLFMCPCHGGVYYEDGSRAAGPPERGLFERKYKVEDGKLFIRAGELPTPGSAANTGRGGQSCA